MEERKRTLISQYVYGKRTIEGLSLRAFANKYGVSKTLIVKYESGAEDEPSLLVAQRFCKTFDIPFEIFVSDFNYVDKNITSAFQAVEELKNNVSMHPLAKKDSTICLNFFLNCSTTLGLSDFSLCDEQITTRSKKGLHFIYDAKCIDNNKNTVYMYNCPEHNPTVDLYSSRAFRFINYIHAISEIELGAQNFIVLVPDEQIFKHLSSLTYNYSENHVLLVLHSKQNTLQEFKQLF